MSGRNWKRIHWLCAFTWLTLAIPTILWWRDSIMWVAFMSLYANVASHFAAAQAAHVEEKVCD